jgi:site-specific recombinase XerD
VNPKILGLKTAHQEFLDFLRQKGRASATILAYGADLKQLIEFCQRLKRESVSDINQEDLKAFKEFLAKDGYTPKSISRKINSIKTFFKYLYSQKSIKDNPAASLSHPKYEIKAPRILSKMEYRALRDVCRNDVRIFAIVELFLQTGIRIGELANLLLEDIKKNSLQIRAYESRPARKVPLNQAAQTSLENYLKVRPKSKSKHLFITKTGKPFLVRNIRSTINRYFKLAGIENAKVNDLRHTFIAHQLKAGTPLTLVSKLTGHKRLSTTEKYLSLVKKSDSEKFKLEEL